MLRGIFMPPGVTPEQVDVLRRPAEEGARDCRSGRSSWRRAPSTRPSMTGEAFADWAGEGRGSATAR
ncbi:MAG: hypothetical protein MZW92_64445 [Comamonadaceae bacterium]|nr:hypothetical protein [Comamonadaceae bacterium]